MEYIRKNTKIKDPLTILFYHTVCNINAEGGCVCAGGDGMWELCNFHPKFWCELKTALKKEFY